MATVHDRKRLPPAGHSKATIELLTSSAPITNLALGGRTLHVSFWPYYKSNPYQDLLHGRNGANYEIAPASLPDAIERQKQRPDDIAVFHLHWLNQLIKIEHDAATAKTRADDFLGQ